MNNGIVIVRVMLQSHHHSCLQLCNRPSTPSPLLFKVLVHDEILLGNMVWSAFFLFPPLGSPVIGVGVRLELMPGSLVAPST
jgi:hypothetical protein